MRKKKQKYNGLLNIVVKGKVTDDSRNKLSNIAAEYSNYQKTSNPLEATFDPDNGYIYVANTDSGTVSVIDAVIATITGALKQHY